jgi:D-proline reductase (dithiol) PrdB
MGILNRFYHQTLAWAAGRWPKVADRLVASFRPRESAGAIPWTPPAVPLHRAKIALVTTAGLHHLHQKPFNMADRNGDPTFRPIDGARIETDFRITHDYYDHRDAERDLNIIFPITRLREMRAAGLVGSIADTHLSFMGHIDGPYVAKLVEESAPQAAGLLRDQRVDIVLLTPA